MRPARPRHARGHLGVQPGKAWGWAEASRRGAGSGRIQRGTWCPSCCAGLDAVGRGCLRGRISPPLNSRGPTSVCPTLVASPNCTRRASLSSWPAVLSLLAGMSSNYPRQRWLLVLHYPAGCTGPPGDPPFSGHRPLSLPPHFVEVALRRRAHREEKRRAELGAGLAGVEVEGG